MNEESICERIKKLLRLAQSSNEHEAKLALERAFELAAKYNVDVAKLELDDAAGRLVDVWFGVGLRITFLQRRALGIVQTFFNVSLCRNKARIVFVGTAVDIQIAWYVYEFLIGEGTRRLAEFKQVQRLLGRRNTKRKRESFVQGFVYGVATQLQKRRDQLAIDDNKFAIVLSENEKARQARLDELIPNRVDTGRRLKDANENALMQGYKKGRETNINKPLERPAQLRLVA